LILLPITGRGTVTAIIALTLYNLQIIYRNIVTGLANVPEASRDAGRGMGMTERQLLWRVELPLAVPEIIAGLRIATVSTVAIATLAIFAGAGGLGEVIYTQGLQNDVFKTAIVVGSGIAIAMAVAFDAFYLTGQRVISPWRTVRPV
jgi:osmoprotectant transport system permease protein